ncbi:basic leucine zipper transcriptional factor ATF-like 2 [Petaurus breviceps papuanus]|uniref:basic leucine zipper transcriptional factor ATF-like 2 n=1 Tax=Petaurus breviceps papuanus TaxID=3040969 RepID=UPI0036DD2729
MHLCSGAHPSKEGKLLLVTDPREVDRELKRRQKNRAASQRSRQKHTDKADELHQEHEWLERDNRALRKEIWSLRAEVTGWLQALEEHQCVCLPALVPASAQTPSARGQAPLGVQTLPTPSAQPPPPSSPGLFSAHSLSSSLTPFLVTSPLAGSYSGAALTQTHGASSLLASSSGVSLHLPAPPQPSACLLPLGARNLREGRTEDVVVGPSATPHPEGSRQGLAWVLSSTHF